MKAGIRHFLIVAPLLMILLLALAAGGATTGLAVFDNYPPDWGHSVGDLSASPASGACRGSDLAISGSGATPNSSINVSMVASGWGPGYVGGASANLGTAGSDGSGSWTLRTTVPREVSIMPSYNFRTNSGSWTIVATWLPNFTGYTLRQNQIIVLDCDQLDSRPLPSSDLPETLPGTGYAIPTVAILVTGLLAIGGLALGIGRMRD